MLHIIQTSPFNTDLLARLARRALPHDAFLLVGDGCYAIANPEQLMAAIPDCGALYMLESDARARGLHHQQSTVVELIDYDRFVTLSIEHPQSITW